MTSFHVLFFGFVGFGVILAACIILDTIITEVDTRKHFKERKKNADHLQKKIRKWGNRQR